MKQIKLFFKGLIIGFGKIIPGVSGSILAILFGVYEIIIESIANPKNIKKNIKIIVPLGSGIIFSIIFGSEIIDFLLSNYYLTAMSFFIGLMSYEIIPLIKSTKKNEYKIKDISSSLIATIFLISLLFINLDIKIVNDYSYPHKFISLILCGIIDAGSSIIPGISGTAILMILGYYEEIISSFASPFNLSSISVVIPFTIGFIFGLIIISKIVVYLLKKYKNCMELSIVSFTIFSIIYLILTLSKFISQINIISVFISFIIGFSISLIIESYNQ